jgi:hypothetical protein
MAVIQAFLAVDATIRRAARVRIAFAPDMWLGKLKYRAKDGPARSKKL